jgi:ferritin-like metal-binding protein YciE
MNDLHELFIEELSDIYDAEKQLIKALPKMAKHVENEELQTAFERHLEQTKKQKDRLDQVFEALDEKPKRKSCKGMAGLIAEGEEMASELEDSSALDAGLICAAQKVEHYEIASYGCLCTWAEEMGHTEALRLLKENLKEEKQTDDLLTDLAEQCLNVEALEEEEA